MSRAPARPALFTLPFALASLASFFGGLALHSFIHLPGFLQTLGAGEVEIGSLFSVMALAAILARPVIGKLIDSRGRRLLIIASSLAHVFVCASYLLVHSIGAGIVLIRICHGVVEGTMFSALFTYAADIVPESRRTEGIALFGVSGLLPMALGGVVGDLVVPRAGYSGLFALSIGFALLGLLPCLKLHDRQVVGAGDSAARSFLSSAIDPNLMPLWFIGTVFATSLSSVFVFIKTFILENAIGSVGGFLTAYALAASVLRISLGWIPDRLGPKRVLFPAIVCVGLGLWLLSQAASSGEVLAAGALTGLGHGFAFPILAGLVVTRAPPAERGAAIALFTAVFDCGMLIGGPLFGLLVARGGYSLMYLCSGSVCAGGALVFALWDARVLARRVEPRTAGRA